MIDTQQERWSEGDVFANGIHQHYSRIVKNRPTLLLLHGFTENGLCWSRLARALEQDYDIIMVDARGHGRSSGPETGYAQELLTRDVVGLIQALELQQPYVFGFSNGALTAARVAATVPDLVRAVILEDPPWSAASALPSSISGNEPWPGYTAWLNAWIDWHKALRTQTFEERVASSQQFLPPGALDWPEEELMSHLEAQAQFNLDVLNYSPLVPSATPWRETVEHIACPILLLTGDPERGSSVSQPEARHIAASWRQGQHVAFPQSSHFLHHEMHAEHFEHFISVLKTFLNKR
jgi:N-formylmaleamate deformylase